MKTSVIHSVIFFAAASLWTLASCAGPAGAPVEKSNTAEPTVDVSDSIVEHPNKLEFKPLVFTPPERGAYRNVLPSGVVVYVVEDDSLPLVDLAITIRAGTYLETEGQAGLARATGNQLRAGGTTKYTPEEFDEEVDFLAAQMGASIGDLKGSASLNCLTKDLDRVLELFFDMLQNPRFDQARLDLYKNQLIQSLERRNDSTGSIESREWSRLIRGTDHFTVDHVTKASVEAITREAMLAFHKAHVQPKRFIVAVSGDVKKTDILAKLEKRFAGWDAPETPDVAIPPPTHAPEPGVYIVDKPDVNQGRVTMGHLGIKRSHPDYFPVQVMNHILGGGGFVSRITSRVRSDEGLAYTARSRYDFGIYYDGVFRAYFQSKNESVAQAMAIVIEEVERVRNEKVSEKELSSAISYFLGSFPRMFATPSQVAATFAADELTGRADDFWKTFRDKLQAVTSDDVQRVAKEHLRIDKLVMLVVGKEEDLLKGNPDRPDFSLKKIAGGRDFQRISLPDPLTLKYE